MAVRGSPRCVRRAVSAALLAGAFRRAGAEEFAAGDVDWSYKNPAFWKSVEGWECNMTGSQSPIDIATSSAFAMNFALMPLSSFFNGSDTGVLAHAVTRQSVWEVEFQADPEAYIQWSGKRFNLQKALFHSPSENTIDGRHYNLEAQLLHTSEDGDTLVAAQLFDVGKMNDCLEQIWADFPRNASTNPVAVPIRNPYHILAPSAPGAYYQWMGSLTTPPCTPGVTWVLAAEVGQVSQAQLDAFRRGLAAVPGSRADLGRARPGHPGGWGEGGNSRPTQPLLGRLVSLYNASLMLVGAPTPKLGAHPNTGAKAGCAGKAESKACPVFGGPVSEQHGMLWSLGPTWAKVVIVSLGAAVIGVVVYYTCCSVQPAWFRMSSKANLLDAEAPHSPDDSRGLVASRRRAWGQWPLQTFLPTPHRCGDLHGTQKDYLSLSVESPTNQPEGL